MKSKEWSFIDKDEWLRGQWDEEPDCVRWIDENTGYLCMIARHPMMGFLCGYVGVPWNHRYWRLHYDWIGGLNAHGGVTYAGDYSETGPVSHVLTSDLAGSRWFFGFDCGHFGDKFDMASKPTVDRYRIEAGDGPGPECPGRYRDIGFVRHNCSLLARQLKSKELRGWRIILSPWWRRLPYSCKRKSVYGELNESMVRWIRTMNSSQEDTDQ